jgi:CO/xanthine dehydrogenase Mo-binding subunit
MRDTPLNPSNLRAPGKPANVFAVESFTDEIAATLGADPLEFRTARLTDPRALEVLRRAAAAFGWQRRPSPAGAAPIEGALWVAGWRTRATSSRRTTWRPSWRWLSTPPPARSRSGASSARMIAGWS